MHINAESWLLGPQKVRGDLREKAVFFPIFGKEVIRY